jgi:hypothetical protein
VIQLESYTIIKNKKKIKKKLLKNLVNVMIIETERKASSVESDSRTGIFYGSIWGDRACALGSLFQNVPPSF